MPAIDQISDSVFKDTITRAVHDVFKTMFGIITSLDDDTWASPLEKSANERTVLVKGQLVVGTVGFVGDISGLIYLYLDTTLAKKLSSQLLGMSAKELEEAGDEVVNDVVGELTNMTVGTFKNQLCDQGFPCKLTIPSILRGSNFSIEPINSATRRLYRFKVGDHFLVADLLMQQGD